ncbi:MAG: response regulator transcription factor [Halioglobus sp.]
MSSRVLVIDDHPIVRDSLTSALHSLRVFDEVETADSFQSMVERLDSDAGFNMLILDLSLSDTFGSRSVEFIREQYTHIPILIFSAFDSPDIIAQCFEYGVHGFVSKSSPMQTIVMAIQVVLAGGLYIPPSVARSMGFEVPESTEAQNPLQVDRPQFTPKQQEVFDQLLQGLPNKVIARRLGIAEGTVKTHLHGIYQILRVTSRAQAILKSRQLKLSG